jgi:hypothetical protein
MPKHSIPFQKDQEDETRESHQQDEKKEEDESRFTEMSNE